MVATGPFAGGAIAILPCRWRGIEVGLLCLIGMLFESLMWRMRLTIDGSARRQRVVLDKSTLLPLTLKTQPLRTLLYVLGRFWEARLVLTLY